MNQKNDRERIRQGIWALADPKISITSLASMTIGASVAALEGPIDWFWFAMLGLAMFCMEVAKNAWGDVYDYDSGTQQQTGHTVRRAKPVINQAVKVRYSVKASDLPKLRVMGGYS